MKLNEQIEKLIDQSSVEHVLQAMEEVCYEKASHVRENYPNDKNLIRYWTRLSDRIKDCNYKVMQVGKKHGI
jgi:hypothetical protein